MRDSMWVGPEPIRKFVAAERERFPHIRAAIDECNSLELLAEKMSIEKSVYMDVVSRKQNRKAWWSLLASIAIVAALLLCSCDVDPTTGSTVPVCDICVNEKTCPDGLCDTSAYEACVAAKVVAGMCEPLTSAD